MDFSESAIRKDCPHCDPNSFALTYPLRETANFWVVCDVHPLTKGHLLIIPKAHLSCVGEYPENIYDEFIKLYSEFSDFLKNNYGSVSSFEHGKIGQTVYHSHVQMFPYAGPANAVVPEGESYLTPLNDLKELNDAYTRDGAYLFYSIGPDKWIVDVKIGKPRFFRDRFARALGNPDRGNWKEMHNNPQLMAAAENDIQELLSSWKNYSPSRK